MAAFVLFVLAVAGAVVVADLVWENTTVGQIAVFHHTVTAYPEGWLLAIAAGLGFVVALLLVASVNSTKGRGARHLGGPARPAGLRGERPSSRADDHQRWVTPQPIQHPAEPLYQQMRSAHVRAGSRPNGSSIPRAAL